MIAKALAVLGLLLNAAGTVLLWRSSPSGYGLTPYANESVLQEAAAVAKRMSRGQRIAICLLMLGAACQFPLIVLG